MSFPVEKIVPEWALNLFNSDEENNVMSENLEEDEPKSKRQKTMFDFFPQETFSSTNNNNRSKSDNARLVLRDITNLEVID